MPKTDTKRRKKEDDEILVKLDKLIRARSQKPKKVIREPVLLSRSHSNLQDLKNSEELAIHEASKIIHTIAIGGRPNSILVTNSNEVLASDGIHGKIAQVGVGFGTGRHTAMFRTRLQTEAMLHAENPVKISERVPKKPRI